MADSLVAKYILPYSPVEVQAVDKRQYEQLKKLTMKIEPSHYEQPDDDTTSLAYHKKLHSNGLKISKRLDEIANGILDMCEDEKSLQQALGYSSLSYDYLDLPMYLITMAKIQFKLGNKVQAKRILQRARQHRFSESVSVDIEKLSKN